MAPFRIGIELNSLQCPFKKALSLASQLGADAVTIDARGEFRPGNMTTTALRQLRKMLEDLRLKVSSVTFQTRRGYEVLEDLEQRVEATKKAMDFAFRLGCNVVTNQVGRIPDEADDPAWHTLSEALTDIGRHGQHCGAFLAARTGSEDDTTIRRLIDQLPDGSLFVDYDPGNLIVNGFSANEALSVLGSDILHVHARDGVRDLAMGRGVEVVLGRGSVDFPELLATLQQLGYRGYLTVVRNQSANAIEELGNAVSYLRALGT